MANTLPRLAFLALAAFGAPLLASGCAGPEDGSESAVPAPAPAASPEQIQAPEGFAAAPSPDVSPDASADAVAASPDAGSAPIESGQEPLIVIPVTLTRSDFETPLGQAILAALARDPDTGIEIVAAAPQLNSPEAQAKVDEIATMSAREVFRVLANLGVGANRISGRAIKDGRIATPEIRLYPQ